MPEVRALSSADVTRLQRYYEPLRLPSGPPCMPRRWVFSPTTTGLPRLPATPFQRAVPNTPVDRDGCVCRFLPRLTRPSPIHRRVGVHDFTFEACSGFTRVTARWIAQPPKAAFVTRLRPGHLPSRTACQLPGLPTPVWVDPSSTRVTRPRDALWIPGSPPDGGAPE